MNASPIQQRRAKNILWSAAENYQIEPQFLSFDHGGAANFYLNMIIGLVHKWLDWEKLSVLFDSFEGTVQESLYDGLLWLALEQVVYEKELPQRPVLEALRFEHCQKMIGMSAWLVETDRLVHYQTAWCMENLGKKPFLVPKDAKLLRSLRFKGEWDTDYIIEAYRGVIKKYFKVEFGQKQKTTRKRKPSALQKLFKRRRQVPGRMFRASDVGDEDVDPRRSASSGSLWTGGSTKIDEETYSELEKKFGPQMYSPNERTQIEKEVCQDVHRNNHLYFAGAQTNSQQYQLNRSHYQANRAAYDSAIVRLRDKLKNQLTVQVPHDKIKSSCGKLNCTKVWRNQYLEDNRIFFRTQEYPEPIFSVDILMDASHSQSSRQAVLAAQGYIIAESLSQCGVPVQVHAFNSFRTYTVLQQLRRYDAGRNNDNLFCYQTEGWNRDGLALRAVGKLMEKSPMERRLLVVLTDADPNDECALSMYQEYAGKDGIYDAQGEVQELKKKGIRVVAVFMGLDYNLQTAGMIYGSNCVRITDGSQLAEAISSIIRRQLRDW